MPGVDAVRQKQFKNIGKHEEMRRRRNEGSVELRKARKDEQLMKRRNLNLSDDEDEENTPTDPVISSKSPKKLFEPISLEACVKLFGKGDVSIEEIKQGIESIRRILSRSKNPPIQKVIQLNLIPPLIAGVQHEDAKVRFEAAWALTNVVSGTSEETMAVVRAGGIHPLVNALSSPELYVAEQAAWAIGNVAGDSATLRDVILAAGALQPLLELTKKEISVEFLRTLAWTFSNLCRHKKPHPPIEMIQVILPYITNLLHNPDKPVVTDSLWALSYVTDGPDEHIQLVLETGILARIIDCLKSEDKPIVAPALRTLGNIVTGTDTQTQAVINTGILGEHLIQLMKSGQASLAKESCWLLSNILAGNTEQIKSVVDANLIPQIINCLDQGEFKTQHEAAWAVCNMSTGGSPEQIAWLAASGVIKPICNLLGANDPKTVKVLLDTLNNLLENSLRVGQMDEVEVMVEECGGLDKLESLQQHEDENIYQQSLYIIEKYFSEADEEAEQQPAPNGDGATVLETPVTDSGYNF